MTINEIKQQFEADGNAPAAIRALSELLETTSDSGTREQIFIERGLLHWRMGDRAASINDYNAALRLNPASKAGELKNAVYSILDFYNKDLYNP